MTGKSAGPPRSKLRVLLGRVAALVIGLVTVEALLWLFRLPADEVGFLGVEFAGLFTPDPERFWRLDEDCTTCAANAVGLRGWWPAAAKRPGEYRIVCVGDSNTFGFGVRCEDTWGMRLERLVQAALPGRAVRTVLAGLPGYSTYQSRVLLDRHAAALQPDVTVLYLGAWNDFVAAVHCSDAEYALRPRQAASLRVLRIFERLFGTAAAPQDLGALQIAFRAGNAPNGRRVPLAEFRANVGHMIAVARRAGSRVVVIVPPLPPSTLEQYPIALEYRTALCEVAAAEAAPIVDAPATFARFTAECPAPWQRTLSGDVCFLDFVHPTAMGHELLAKATVEHAGLAPPDSAFAEAGARPTATIESIEPGRVKAFRGGELVLRGRALDASGITERVWIGRQWIQHASAIDDSTLRLTLPRVMTPGVHTITLCTQNGVVEAPVRLVVEPLRLDASARRGDAWIDLDITLTGPKGWPAAAWVSTARRSEPAPTFAGSFHLHAAAGGRPADRPDLPFRFDQLDIPAFAGKIDETETWRLRQRLPVPNFGDTKSIFVQAACWDPKTDGEGALSDVVELTLR